MGVRLKRNDGRVGFSLELAVRVQPSRGPKGALTAWGR